MEKQAGVDIRNLFNKFGGDSGKYKEIQRDQDVERAQQNWPIVDAIERARVEAPRLRSSGVKPEQAAQIPSPGFLSQAHTPASQASSQVSAARTPVQSLFGGLASPQAQKSSVSPVVSSAQPASEVGASPLRNLFASSVASQPMPSALQQSPRSENDTLDTVFSRLLKPQAQPDGSPPDRELRTLFGFLNK